MTTTVKVSVNGAGYVALVSVNSNSGGTVDGCRNYASSYSETAVRESDGEQTFHVGDGCNVSVTEMSETEFATRTQQESAMASNGPVGQVG